VLNKQYNGDRIGGQVKAGEVEENRRDEKGKGLWSHTME